MERFSKSTIPYPNAALMKHNLSGAIEEAKVGTASHVVAWEAVGEKWEYYL